MASKKIVIALGGNALGNTPEEQFKLVQLPAKKIAELAKLKYQVIVGHGNGPQVGMIYNAFADANNFNKKNPNVPFPEAGGMSQGYIGYHLTTALTNAYLDAKVKSEIVYFLTETIVDANDPAFKKPTKPVGPFYKTLAEAKAQNPGSTIVEDAGRGYRKVVASPTPVNFLGINTIKKAIAGGATVVVGGGGGIPIINKNKKFTGVDGVIDKDFALAKIADLVDADIFIVLTAVKYVAINFNKPNQKSLKNVTVKELQKHLKDNQFAAGSMKPKVEAAIKFVGKSKKRVAYIGDLNDLSKIIAGKSGTKVTA
ncbi:carbamate kinase [Mycoplasmoides pirum]|uniref:carbamate kinase n=1 Tax=Mycoplasmoides pirum TaxID=2122 RepID=UPI000568F931|nr:carbamate kinase [Mycoplasmoides pirum]